MAASVWIAAPRVVQRLAERVAGERRVVGILAAGRVVVEVRTALAVAVVVDVDREDVLGAEVGDRAGQRGEVDGEERDRRGDGRQGRDQLGEPGLEGEGAGVLVVEGG